MLKYLYKKRGKKLSVSNAIRDALIIFFMTFIGGVVFALSGINQQIYANYALYVWELIFLFAGFFLIAYWAQAERFKHLHVSAFTLWLLSAVNLFDGQSILDWIIVTGLSICGVMLVTEGVFRIFRPDRKKQDGLIKKTAEVKHIIGDGLAVYYLTMVAGYVLGMFEPDDLVFWIGLASILIFFTGFCVSGILVSQHKLTHLQYVATVIWMLSGFNIFLGVTFFDWLVGGVILYGIAFVSWGILYFYGRWKPSLSEYRFQS